MGFRIDRVYTRSGDEGKTGLVGGKRVKKDNLRVAAYGEIDELNSILGLVKERLSSETVELKEVIEFLQQELFDLGSELATPPSAEYEKMLKVSDEQVARLEKGCDSFADGLPALTSFILPGGSETAALLHVGRTVCRRAERTLVALASLKDDESAVSPAAIKYVNRLSDLLFILARWSLQAERKDSPVWVKGGHPIPSRFR